MANQGTSASYSGPSTDATQWNTYVLNDDCDNFIQSLLSSPGTDILDYPNGSYYPNGASEPSSESNASNANKKDIKSHVYCLLNLSTSQFLSDKINVYNVWTRRLLR